MEIVLIAQFTKDLIQELINVFQLFAHKEILFFKQMVYVRFAKTILKLIKLKENVYQKYVINILLLQEMLDVFLVHWNKQFLQIKENVSQ